MPGYDHAHLGRWALTTDKQQSMWSCSTSHGLMSKQDLHGVGTRRACKTGLSMGLGAKGQVGSTQALKRTGGRWSNCQWMWFISQWLEICQQKNCWSCHFIVYTHKTSSQEAAARTMTQHTQGIDYNWPAWLYTTLNRNCIVFHNDLFWCVIVPWQRHPATPNPRHV